MRRWTAMAGVLLPATLTFAQIAEFGASGGLSRFPAKVVGYAYSRSQFSWFRDTSDVGIHQGYHGFLVYATPQGKKIHAFAAASRKPGSIPAAG